MALPGYIPATGSKPTFDKMTGTGTPKLKARNIPVKTPDIARPTIHNDTTNSLFTEAEVIVRLNDNSTHAA